MLILIRDFWRIDMGTMLFSALAREIRKSLAIRRLNRARRTIEVPAWERRAGGRFSVRRYDSYEDYVAHQKSKLALLEGVLLEEYDREFVAQLAARLRKVDRVKSGASVLCLAARLGSEVKAFRALGCFAVGIDLNPGPANPLVVVGDFHALQFADRCVDVVFTNSLDHSYDLEKMLAEVRRVLKPEGLFVVEAAMGEREGISPSTWEAFSWETVDDLIARLSECGFELIAREQVRYPWLGMHLVLKKREPDTAR